MIYLAMDFFNLISKQIDFTELYVMIIILIIGERSHEDKYTFRMD